MLHKNSEIVSPETITLIRELQKLKTLSTFNLVGGTALALQLGHRNSIDIDLFTQQNFNGSSLADTLRETLSIRVDSGGNNLLLSYINSIKVDFICHNYPFVNPPIQEEGITFLSKEDITAMKLNAIARSGKRLKDFIDIYFLLEHFSVNDMLYFFSVKYPDTNTLIPLRALDYFSDIDEAIDPPKLLRPITLQQIKTRISEAIIHSKRTFS